MKVQLFFIFCFFGFYHSTLAKNIIFDDSQNSTVASNELSLENLDLMSLLDAASTNETERHRANEVFKSKFGDKRLKITSIQIPKTSYSISSDILSIDCDIAEKFLKAFGQSIEDVVIEYSFIPVLMQEEIGQFVNSYCFETLKTFRAEDCSDGAFETMIKPFEKVERVVVEGDWHETVNGDSLGFGEMFPKIHTLNIMFFNGFIVDRLYPNLKELSATLDGFTNFAELIEKNPQIEELFVKETSMELLNVINKNLIHLESLSMAIPNDLKSYNGSIINFEQVKEVAISDMRRNIEPEKIAFNQVKHFELLVDGIIKDEWIEIIGSNKQLENLTITAGYFNNRTLLKLSENVTNLIEAKIKCDIGTNVETVAQFLEKNEKMKTVTLHLRKGSVMFFESLTEILEHEWTLSVRDKTYSRFTINRLELPTDVNYTEIGGQNLTTPKNSTTESGSQASGVAPTCLFIALLIVLPNIIV